MELVKNWNNKNRRVRAQTKKSDIPEEVRAQPIFRENREAQEIGARRTSRGARAREWQG